MKQLNKESSLCLQLLLFQLLYTINTFNVQASQAFSLYSTTTIDIARWTRTSLQPTESKSYGSSVALCAMACQLEGPEACEAFRITDTAECEFGQITDCSVAMSREVSSAIKVSYDKSKYSRDKVYEMHTVGKTGEPVDTFTDTGCDSGSPILSIPTPEGGDFSHSGMSATQYKAGYLFCGGHGSNDKRCQYWRLGASEMSDTGQPMNYAHWSGYTVSLGRDEILIVGGKQQDPARTEILEKDGIWKLKENHPEPIRFTTLIAKSSQMVYSFGGEEAKNNPLPKKTVYKYNRMANKWTKMPDMPVPVGGPEPNCAKVHNFRNVGKDVVLCFGARHEGGDMFAFDMKSETWEDLGITAPTPPSHMSVIFIHNNNLYRFRGSHKDNTPTIYNGMHFFDLNDLTWSEGFPLTGSSTTPFTRRLFKFNVVYKLT